jgi:hypothetical protein
MCPSAYTVSKLLSNGSSTGISWVCASQHLGTLSLGYLSCPGLGACAPAGVCACVAPYWGVPPDLRV